MIDSYEKQRRLHHDMVNVGMRAQATAIGFVQLCVELERVGVLNASAVDRIKCVISEEIALSAPRTMSRERFRSDARARLDRLFAGKERMGSADVLDFE